MEEHRQNQTAHRDKTRRRMKEKRGEVESIALMTDVLLGPGRGKKCDDSHGHARGGMKCSIETHKKEQRKRKPSYTRKRSHQALVNN